MRVDHEKDRRGETSPLERAMGSEFTMRKSEGVRVRHEKEQWGESLPSERAMG